MPYFSTTSIPRSPENLPTPAHSHLNLKNYLFLVPDELNAFERAILISTATKMCRYGLVFVSDITQKRIERIDGVYYLPFCIEKMPEFCDLEAVVVMHHELLALLAARLYPSARLFTITTSEESDETTLVMRAGLDVIGCPPSAR